MWGDNWLVIGPNQGREQAGHAAPLLIRDGSKPVAMRGQLAGVTAARQMGPPILAVQ